MSAIQGRKLGALLIGAAVAFALSANAAEPEAVPGEFVVQLKNSALLMNSTALSARLGGKVLRTIPSANAVVIKRSLVEKSSVSVKSLNSSALVERAEPNYIYRVSGSRDQTDVPKVTPNDPKMTELWGMINEGQKDSDGTLGVAGMDIGASEAWAIETGSSDIIVAISDTGVDYNHPDLIDNAWINEAEQNGTAGVDDDANGLVDDIHGADFANNDADPMDDHGHGTHCAGTIGASGNDGKGIVGVAWKVRIMGAKFLTAGGSGTLEGAVKSIDYATQMGAHIISASWGGGGESDILRQSIERARDKGIVFIAAAGNDSSNNDSRPSYPASYNVSNIVAVAALGNKGEMASFSNYGKQKVHVAAPGQNIVSSLPNGGYDSWSGTSMATPHVSGIAALLKSKFRDMTPEEMKGRLIKTSRPLASLNGKVTAGGIVSAPNALNNVQAPPDPNDPAMWPSRDVTISSKHPYDDMANEVTEVRQEGATKMALFFSKFDTEKNYDFLEIYDSTGKLIDKLSGSNDETWSATIEGDYAKLVFKSDDSVKRHGYDITKIAYKTE
ncbi:MAG: S8 family serine peptidase [Pseudobdellovibrionaceae bacterium]